MEKEKLQKKIEAKLDGLEESIKYQIETQCELLSGLRTVQYLMYLVKSEEKI